MNIIPGIDVTASALSAENTHLEVIGENIANAQTTRGPDGLPYQRKVVSFEAALQDASGGDSGAAQVGVRIGSITADRTPGEAVYNPSHPHADANGMVHMPNVNLAHEMVDLITASRSYDANLSVVRIARQMAQHALQIGR